LRMLLKLLDRVEEGTCAIMLIFMAGLAFINVVVRYLTNFSFAFTEELLVNLFVWITLLGASIATRKGSLLGVTYLFDRFPRKMQKATVAFGAVCGVTLFVLLAFHGAEMVRSEFRSGMTTYSMALPMWIFGMALPVCALVLIFRTVQKAVEDWKAISSGKGLPDEACPPEVMSE